MASLKYFVLTILLTQFYLLSYTQSKTVIDKLSAEYQTCLDKGIGMEKCAGYFSYQMDSLLNLCYNQLRYNCDRTQKENLKSEQLNWLAKRDIEFKINKKKAKTEAKLGEFTKVVEQMFFEDKNAKTIKKRVLELSKKTPSDYSASKYYVNPTGVYKLNSEVKIKDNDTFGYFGSIAAKQISKNKVVINFFICKGAPSYSSGNIIDTLEFKNNKAIYRKAEFDSLCKIIFTFYKQGIKVEEFTNNYNTGCGFGHAVVANGYFNRKTNRVPTRKELISN